MIKISDKEFKRLTEYLRENYGINLIKKRTLIESRLNNHMQRNGFDNYTDYLNYAVEDKSGREMSNIINILTTNYSYFMREWEHFRYFKEELLPEVMPKVVGRDLRTWSAGCSSGQEPYTMAMLISDYLGGNKAGWDTKVLATDISLKALSVGKEGIYSDESLNGVPAGWKYSYFEKASNIDWRVKDSLKKEVIFRRFNLMDEHFPFKKKFHVIFCRNVMIYFNEQTKQTLIEKFYNSLENGGYLFIGQSESINRNENSFKYVMPSIYKKVG